MIRVLCLLLTAALSAPSWAVTLEDLRWERRLVLAYGDPESREMQRLQALARTRGCALAERDVDIYRVEASAGIPLTPGGNPLHDPRLAALHSASLGFELVLVGKDGGVKARSPHPGALAGFFERIDGMPMRRREMAARGRVCGD